MVLTVIVTTQASPEHQTMLHLFEVKAIFSVYGCVCIPSPPGVPVSASLLSQLILIYGLTLFPAG